MGRSSLSGDAARNLEAAATVAGVLLVLFTGADKRKAFEARKARLKRR